MTAPIPDDLEDGIVGKGFPIEVYNVLGAGDAFMSGFLRGWLSGETARDLAPPGPMPAAPSPCRACSARRNIRPGRAAALPRARQHGTRAAQGRGAQPPALGDDAPARHARADGARHRPSRAARGLAAGADAAQSASALQAAGREGGGTRRRAAGQASACCSTTRYGREALFDAGAGTLWIGQAGRAAGLAAAALRIHARTSAAGWSSGRSTTASSAVLLSPRRSGRRSSASRPTSCAPALRRRAQGRPRAPDRDHRRQARPARRRHGRARAGGTLRRRHQARLVEARAAGVAPRLGGDRRGDRKRAIRSAAASCCSGSMRRRETLEAGFRRGAQRRRRSRALRSAARSSATPPRAWLAGDDDRRSRPIADMARRFEALTEAWQRWRDRGGLIQAAGTTRGRTTDERQDHPPDHGAGAGAIS